MSETKPPGKIIEFISFHEPPLRDGDYEITVTQTIADNIKAKTSFSNTHAFSIQGPRVNLGPSDIVSVFPPSGSAGDHAATLPHVIFSRGTLPWERSGGGNSGDLPWLALLVFGEPEAPAPQTISRADLQTGTGKNVYAALETGEMADEKLTVIDLPVDHIEALIPTAKELKLLCHVRQWKDESGQNVTANANGGDSAAAAAEEKTNDRAVVVANRLPIRGGTSVVHLVSVESRYQGDKIDTSLNVVDGNVRLVSLKSWRFSCPEHVSYRVTSASAGRLRADKNAPAGLADKLAALTAPGSASPLTQAIAGEDSFWAAFNAALPNETLDDNGKQAVLRATRYQTLSFRALLHDIGREPATLRLPDDAVTAPAGTPRAVVAQARTFLRRSYLPLPHQLRNGNETVSWYHGPLVSGHNQAEDPSQDGLKLPVRTADQLLRYHDGLGMLDTSYAGAWELGRLLALESKQFSTSLFQWKRAHAAHAEVIRTGEAELAHLPFNQLAIPPHEPQIIGSWLYDLARLRGVPFQYLVPDARMLPHESLRFFHVDGRWVECLLDGAFSIGRVGAKTQQQDQDHHDNGRGPADLNAHPVTQAAAPIHEVTGALLRSAVVASWPDLQVDGYAAITTGVADFQTELNQPQPTVSAGLQSALTACKLSLTSPITVEIISHDEIGRGAQTRSVGTAWRLTDAAGRSIELRLEEGRLLIPLQRLRQDILGSDSLIALFAGAVAVLDVHQKPEALHFGFGYDPQTGYFKELRQLDSGRDIEDLTVTVPLIDEKTRIIDLIGDDGLKNRLETALSQRDGTTINLNAALLALEMIEGVVRVRFEANTASAQAP